MFRTKLFTTKRECINGLVQDVEIDVQMNKFLQSSNVELVDIKYVDTGVSIMPEENMDESLSIKSALMIYKLITYK